MTPREPDATDGRGRRRGRAEEPMVSSEETGWLDDLRSAKKSKDRLSAGDDPAEGGSGRWAKLRALSDDPDAPAESAPRGRPAEQLPQRVPGAARPVSGGPQQPAPSRRGSSEGPVSPAAPSRRGSSDGRVSPAGSARHGSSDAPVKPTAQAATPPAGRRHAAGEPQTQPPRRRRAQPDAPVSPPPADRRPGQPAAAHQAAEESAHGKHSGAPSSDPLVRPAPASRGEGGPKRQLPEQDPVRPVRHGMQPPSGLPPQPPRTGNHSPVAGSIPDARAGAAGAPPAQPTAKTGPAGPTPRRAEPSRGPAAPRSATAAGPAGPMARPTSPAGGGSVPNGPGGTGSGPAGARNAAAGTGGGPGTGPTAGPLPGGSAVAGLPTGSGPAGRPVSSAAPRAARPGTPSDPVGPASTGRAADAATPTGLPGPDGEAPGGRGVGGRGVGGRAGLAAGVDAIRGARSEVRRQLREQQRLRMWTLIATVVMVVGALPLYFLLRAATRDPVLTGLDALQVPDWATGETVDNLSGSRWCLMECRYRERTSKSEREMDETFKAYQTALAAAGWNRWKSQACPTEVDGGPFSCWRRDEYTMEIWVRQPACMTDPMYARPTIKPTKESDAAPGAEPTDPAAQCFGSVVTIKVMNAIADDKYLHQEAPAEQPLEDELTDEDLEDSPSPTP